METLAGADYIDEKATTMMEDLVLTVVEALVDDENSFNVTPVAGSNNTVVFEVKVDNKEIGRVIGKRGSTANAIRHILTASSAKFGIRTILEISEREEDK